MATAATAGASGSPPARRPSPTARRHQPDRRRWRRRRGGAGIPGGGPGSVGRRRWRGRSRRRRVERRRADVSFATITRNGEGADGTDGHALDVSTPGATGSTGDRPARAQAPRWSRAGTTTLTRSILSGNGCDVAPALPRRRLGVAFQSPGCPGAGAIRSSARWLTTAVPPSRCGRAGQRGPGPRPGRGVPHHGPARRAAPGRGGLRQRRRRAGPPLATTGAPGFLTTTTADVGGDVDTRGLPAEYYVDFGPTTSYGGRTAGVPSPAPRPIGRHRDADGAEPGHHLPLPRGRDRDRRRRDRRRSHAHDARRRGDRRGHQASTLRILGVAISPRRSRRWPTTAVRPPRRARRAARGARITVRLSRRAPR